MLILRFVSKYIYIGFDNVRVDRVPVLVYVSGACVAVSRALCLHTVAIVFGLDMAHSEYTCLSRFVPTFCAS
jgi:hypothetical protein